MKHLVHEVVHRILRQSNYQDNDGEKDESVLLLISLSPPSIGRAVG